MTLIQKLKRQELNLIFQIGIAKEPGEVEDIETRLHAVQNTISLLETQQCQPTTPASTSTTYPPKSQ